MQKTAGCDTEFSPVRFGWIWMITQVAGLRVTSRRWIFSLSNGFSGSSSANNVGMSDFEQSYHQYSIGLISVWGLACLNKEQNQTNVVRRTLLFEREARTDHGAGGCKILIHKGPSSALLLTWVLETWNDIQDIIKSTFEYQIDYTLLACSYYCTFATRLG